MSDFREIIQQIEMSADQKNGIRQLYADQKYIPDESWQLHCFLISLLRDQLTSAGLLDQAVICALGANIPERMPYLTQMLARSSEDYHKYLRRMSPYLIYIGDDTCFGALSAFSYGIGEALEAAGYQVQSVAKKDRTPEFYESLAGRTFRGIIATQDTAFCHKTTDGRYLHDLIDAPLYWMDYDHPAWFMDLITDMPQKTVYLTVDRNYASYIEKYYHRHAVFFPPAAEKNDNTPDTFEGFRDWKLQDIRYPLSFVGTLQDNLADDMSLIHSTTPEYYDLAEKLVSRMKSDPALTQEAALTELMPDQSDRKIAQIMHGWAFIGKDLAHSYRKQIVRALLDAGIELHVFHDSWKIFDNYPNLHIHPSVSYDKTDDIYHQSLISLNTMTWHKAGFTERIANAQMQGALSATDDTAYIRENYISGRNILKYVLTDESIIRLPERISELLHDHDRLLRMAYNGMKKAAAEHTWDNRAKSLIRMQLSGKV